MLRVRYFGTTLGSPPGEPGGGITVIFALPGGGIVAKPGSIPAGGQITPFDSERCSLRGRLSFEPSGGALTPGGQFRGPGVESGELFCAQAE